MNIFNRMTLMSTHKSSWESIWNIKNKYWFQDHKLRHKIVGIVAGLSTPGSIILDVGCGTGEYLQTIDSLGYNAFGIDLSYKALSLCQSGNVMCASARYLPIADGSIDLILAILIIEHVKEDKRVFQEFTRILKPKGFAIVMVPRTYSLAGLYINIIEHIYKKIRRFLALGSSVYDLIPVHKTFTKKDINSWADHNNLNILFMNHIFASMYTGNTLIRLLGSLLKKMKLSFLSEEFLIVMVKDQGRSYLT